MREKKAVSEVEAVLMKIAGRMNRKANEAEDLAKRSALMDTTGFSELAKIMHQVDTRNTYAKASTLRAVAVEIENSLTY